MRVGSPPSLVRTSVQVTSEMRFSLSGGAPVTTMDKGTRVSLPGQAMLDEPARGSRVDESCGD